MYFVVFAYTIHANWIGICLRLYKQKRHIDNYSELLQFYYFRAKIPFFVFLRSFATLAGELVGVDFLSSALPLESSCAGRGLRPNIGLA